MRQRNTVTQADSFFEELDGHDAAPSPLQLLGQLGASFLLALTLGGLGVILSGDSWPPTALWVLGLVAGATLGTHAMRPKQRELDDDAAWDPHPLLAAAAGAAAPGVVHYALSDAVPYGLTFAAGVVALGSWGAQDLATADGRARAAQRARRLAARLRRSLGSSAGNFEAGASAPSVATGVSVAEKGGHAVS